MLENGKGNRKANRVTFNLMLIWKSCLHLMSCHSLPGDQICHPLMEYIKIVKFVFHVFLLNQKKYFMLLQDKRFRLAREPVIMFITTAAVLQDVTHPPENSHIISYFIRTLMKHWNWKGNDNFYSYELKCRINWKL